MTRTIDRVALIALVGSILGMPLIYDALTRVLDSA